MLIKHNGESNIGKTIYHISAGAEGNDYRGFFALMRGVLEGISYAKSMGLIPVVEWGCGTFYYDTDMEVLSKNAFDYYFAPVWY